LDLIFRPWRFRRNGIDSDRTEMQIEDKPVNLSPGMMRKSLSLTGGSPSVYPVSAMRLRAAWLV
jgi:hypothetical protein